MIRATSVTSFSSGLSIVQSYNEYMICIDFSRLPLRKTDENTEISLIRELMMSHLQVIRPHDGWFPLHLPRHQLCRTSGRCWPASQVRLVQNSVADPGDFCPNRGTTLPNASWSGFFQCFQNRLQQKRLSKCGIKDQDLTKISRIHKTDWQAIFFCLAKIYVVDSLSSDVIQ
jgi:hypothetical protein